jgi:hypothetical protein
MPSCPATTAARDSPLGSRLASNLTAKPLYLMSDQELQEVEAAELAHEKELRKGRGHLHLKVMLTPAERAAKRAAWLIRIRAEIRRRQTLSLGAVVGDPRKELLDKLAEIGDRLRSGPS